MGGYFEGAKRFNLLDNSLTLLALHVGCIGLLTSIADKAVATRFNLVLGLSCFLFGAVFAVLAAYYSILNGRSLGKILEMEGEWADGPPRQTSWRAEMRWAAAFAALVLVAALMLSWLLELPQSTKVLPDYWAAVILLYLVIFPLPLIWSGRSTLVGVMRGVLALSSILAFVFAIALPLLPAAVSNAAEGAGAAATPPAPVIALVVERSGPGPGSESRTSPTVDNGRPDQSPSGPAADDVADTGAAPPSPPADPVVGVTAQDLDRVQEQLSALRGDFARAVAAREVNVRLTDNRQAPLVTVTPEIKVPPSKVIQLAGPPGPPGRDAPVRRCRFSVSSPWFQDCWFEAQPAPVPPS